MSRLRIIPCFILVCRPQAGSVEHEKLLVLEHAATHIVARQAARPASPSVSCVLEAVSSRPIPLVFLVKALENTAPYRRLSNDTHVRD